MENIKKKNINFLDYFKEYNENLVEIQNILKQLMLLKKRNNQNEEEKQMLHFLQQCSLLFLHLKQNNREIHLEIVIVFKKIKLNSIFFKGKYQKSNTKRKIRIR